MKLNKIHAALIGAGLILTTQSYAHVANIDVGSTASSIAGDAPSYIVYTPSSATASGATTYTLKASVINPIPVGFTGTAECPYGGVWLDLTTNPPTPILDVNGNTTPCVYTAASLNQFNAGAWAAGTSKRLGDTHALHGGAYFTFSLVKKSTVTITLARDTAYTPADGLANAFDPGFSLYEHTLADDGHDAADFDPVQPTDPITAYYAASASDKVPYLDPGVAKFTFDPNTGVATLNPAYTTGIDKIYKALYPANGPYRDTLNYTDAFGLDANGFAISGTTNPADAPFDGQFNAKSNFSVASEVANATNPANDPITGTNLQWHQSLNFAKDKKGNPIPIYDGTREIVDPVVGPDAVWSEVLFLAAVNANTGKKAATAETLTVTLQPGDYTIAAGDAGAATGRFGGGTLSVKIK